MSKCDVCGEYYWDERHSCHPIWLVSDDQGYFGDEEIRAFDAEDAAEKAAELYDSGGDYTILNGDAVVFTVKSFDGKVVKIFDVYGESVPTYHATEIGD